MGTRTLAALAVVAVLVAGCTDDPEPKIADPTSTPSSSAASPSPTTSEVADPEQAYRDFIDSYVAAISESLSTGDPSAWLAMSDPGCAGCAGIAEKLAQAYADGGRIEGGSWSAGNVERVASSASGQVWRVAVRSQRETWIGPDGEISQIVDPGVTKFVFTLVGGAATPLMSEIEVQTA